MLIVAAAVVVAIWELHRGFPAKDIDLPEQPLMLGGVVMVVVAYFWGAPALVTATAVTALVIMLWLLRRGIDGYVKNATASVFTLDLRAVPRLVRRAAARRGRAAQRRRPRRRRRAGHHHVHRGHDRLRHRRVRRRRAVRQAPDGAGHLARRSPGRASPARWSSASSPAGRWSVYLLDGDWWVGVALGLIAVVMATLGDLCESVIKRDLGIKDMSQVIPGHGGLMDRLDSLLATVAPIWLLLHYLVFT